MSVDATPKQAEVDRLYTRLKQEAERAGYFLNPDVEFTKSLVNGLLVNQARYGYWACPCRLSDGIKSQDLDIICPCRLSDGIKSQDLDIICPCDYRDADLGQFGTCF